MSENQETEIKAQVKPIIQHPWRVFGFEVFLFVLSMVLGILAGWRLKELFEIEKISPEPVSLWDFLLYFLLATSTLLLVIYFFKHRRFKGVLFKLIFILALAFGNLYFVGLWLSAYFTFAWVLLVVLLLLRKPPIFFHNIVLIFAVAGVGAGLGSSMVPQMVVLLLAVFSVYDFIAVYKTKHMIKMAKEMLSHQAILGIVVPQQISDFRARLKEVKPGGKFLILGAGDIVFPLLLVVSLIPQGIVDSLIVAGFSLLGLFFGFLIFISKKERAPMPALPPIALLSVLGYLLTLIL